MKVVFCPSLLKHSVCIPIIPHAVCKIVREITLNLYRIHIRLYIHTEVIDFLERHLKHFNRVVLSHPVHHPLLRKLSTENLNHLS